MKSSIESKIKGEFHELKGGTKEKAGELVKDSRLESEGTVEKIAGKMQKKFARVQGAVRKS